MLKLIKVLLQDKAFYIASSITLGIAVLSLVNISDYPIVASGSDKIKHAFAYACLSFFWIVTFRDNNNRSATVFWVGVICFIYGTIIEVLQTTITSYRTADLKDMLANFIGIVIGIVTFWLIKRKL